MPQVKIPSNLIVYKYTSGNEYLTKNEQLKYKGYYYELNGKTYAGKQFDANSPELIKATSDNVNKLLNNPFTQIYGLISKINLNQISPSSFSSIPINTELDLNLDVATPEEIKKDPGLSFYYAKKINESVIKQVNKDTYLKLKNSSLYITTTLNKGWTNIEQAETELPGLKAFLNV